MRLPLRHAPPDTDAPLRRCAHLEALAQAAMGLPLRAAADAVSSAASRGRFGSALQWHFGLEPHDGQPQLDWEDRVEIKLVSVWSTASGEVRCDKVKVCDINIDPWHKLSNVLWVFADRLTRVVVGASFTRLAGPRRQALASAWTMDPHFEHPLLFVEAREQAGRVSPAYYIASRWFVETGLLPRCAPWIFAFDSRWWSASRADFGRDPLMTVVDGRSETVACRRCGGPIAFELDVLERCGWSPGRHGLPWNDQCASAGHFVVAADRLLLAEQAAPSESLEALEARVPSDRVWRLADRVAEPEDHGHE